MTGWRLWYWPLTLIGSLNVYFKDHTIDLEWFISCMYFDMHINCFWKLKKLKHWHFYHQFLINYIKNILGLSWPWSYGSWIYNYLCNQCQSPLMLWVRIPLRRGVLDTTLCDQVCQWLLTSQLFFPGTSVPPTNKIDLQDIAEILLKVALIIITKSNHFLLQILGRLDETSRSKKE